MTTEILERDESMKKTAAAKIPPISWDKIKVEVTATANGTGGVTWSHKIKSSGHSNGNKIKVPENRAHRIKFDLNDESGLGIRFNAAGPIFAKEGVADPCPDRLETGQIMVDSCDDDELVVIDWNYGAQQELRYQLNFVTHANGPIDPYDPIIENGGGGVRPLL